MVFIKKINMRLFLKVLVIFSFSYFFIGMKGNNETLNKQKSVLFVYGGRA